MSISRAPIGPTFSLKIGTSPDFAPLTPAAPAARAFANANRRGELNGIGGRDIDGAQSTHSDERKQREPTDQSNKQGGRKRVDCCSGAGVCFHPAGVFNLTPRYRRERP